MADWDVSKPIDHTLVGDLPQKIRDVTSSTKIVLAKEHVQPSTSNAGGQHLKGSNRVYLDSAAPIVDPEGNSLDTSATSDDGRLAVLTGSDNLMRVYIGTSAGVSTGFQRVTVQGLQATTDVSIGGRVLSNIATGTQSGQAIHVAQLDTSAFSIVTPATSGTILPRFGASKTVDNNAAAFAKDTVYKAECAGILTVSWSVINGRVDIYADSIDGATTIVARVESGGTYVARAMSIPLTKDQYVQIASGAGTVTINYATWTPFGTGDLVDQT